MLPSLSRAYIRTIKETTTTTAKFLSRNQTWAKFLQTTLQQAFNWGDRYCNQLHGMYNQLELSLPYNWYNTPQLHLIWRADESLEFFIHFPCTTSWFPPVLPLIVSDSLLRCTSKDDAPGDFPSPHSSSLPPPTLLLEPTSIWCNFDLVQVLHLHWSSHTKPRRRLSCLFDLSQQL